MIESNKDINKAFYRKVILAGDHWMHKIKKGQTFRILDLEGNQAADTLFYCAKDTSDRYSASDTIQRQKNLYITAGTILYSNQGNALLKVTADTCGRHDTLGGACSRESNVMRYAFEKEHMHACRDSFICGLNGWGHEMGKRDITCNINFFMNVPVTSEGKLSFADGISAPGRYVEMVAEKDVIALISNCPQLNNPCNAYNPTPVEVFIWE
ncbi:urea amidolyase associated protein UAAP2 [Rubritalea spongiae]|uniref:Urea amidolyase associated protein UAAP2 n=1 Tax=Rubritalea spongiae TaxID=430797 RepID=A0ABW5E0Y5_9BACT